MTKDKIKEGDICTLDESVEYSYNPHKPYEVVVLWHGVNSQPLVTKLDAYKPFWTTYSQLIEVKGHIDLLIKALEQQTCEDAVSREAVLNLVDNLNDGSFRWASIRTKIARLHLVQPELEPCEDAVSRQAVLDLFAKNCDTVRPYNKTWEEVKALPSVNPQRTGHWIQTQEKDDAEPFILWECSCCHKEFRSVVHKVSNYCPNCGAKMVESQERSDEE